MMIVTRKSHTRKMVMRKKGFIIVMMKIICKGSFFYGEDGNEYK